MKRWYVAVMGAGLCLLAAPALGQDRDPVQARVKLNDLNLNSAAGQRTANGRIDHAARTMCDANEGSGIAGSVDRQRCRQEVLASGASGVARIQAEYRRAEARRIAAERRRATRIAVHHRASKARYRHCYWSKRAHKRVCTARRPV